MYPASEKASASKSRNQLCLASSPLLEEESRGLLRHSLQAPLPTPPSLKDAWFVFYIFLKFLDDVPEYGLFFLHTFAGNSVGTFIYFWLS